MDTPVGCSACGYAFLRVSEYAVEKSCARQSAGAGIDYTNGHADADEIQGSAECNARDDEEGLVWTTSDELEER